MNDRAIAKFFLGVCAGLLIAAVVELLTGTMRAGLLPVGALIVLQALIVDLAWGLYR